MRDVLHALCQEPQRVFPRFEARFANEVTFAVHALLRLLSSPGVVFAEEIVVPGAREIRPMIFINGLMWEVAFNPQTSLLSHLDEGFWWSEEHGCLTVYQERPPLLTRQEAPAHSEEAPNAAFPEQPPQHFRDTFMLRNTAFFLHARDLAKPDTRLRSTDSGYLPQTLRHQGLRNQQ